MFDEIAGIYDLGNHLLSLGQDFFWRKRLAMELRNYQPLAVLDLGSGTGDLAFAVKKQNPDATIIGIDLAKNMLKIGADKILKCGLKDSIFLAQADIEQMPFPEQSFDATTIAFGVRNLEDRSKGLAEIFRILNPGGVFAVLEFSLPEKGFFSRIYRFYLGGILPRLGQLIGGQSAYFYLRDTIQEFPPSHLFSYELAQAGFVIKELTALSLGSVCLYLAEKPKNQG